MPVSSFHNKFDLGVVRGFNYGSKEIKEDKKMGLYDGTLDSLLFVSQVKSFVHYWSQDPSLSLLQVCSCTKQEASLLSNCRFTTTTRLIPALCRGLPVSVCGSPRREGTGWGSGSVTMTLLAWAWLCLSERVLKAL